VSPVLLLVVFVSLVLVPAPGWPGTNGDFEDLTTALTSHGFENVLVSAEGPGTVRVYYENRIYRYQLRAMGVVLALVSEVLEAPWAAEIVPMQAGVPVVSVRTRADDYLRYVAGELDERAFASSLIISTDPPAPELGASSNASFRRVDLSAGPQFAVELEQDNDALRGQFSIVPQAETEIAKGLSATAQLSIPLVDEIEEEGSGVRPGRVTLDWIHRLGPAVGLLRAGIFNPERYGLSFESGEWAWGGKLLFTFKGDYTGRLALYDGVWEYSDIDVLTYSLGAQYRYPLMDVAIKASVGRFLGEEEGGRVDLVRAIGELEMGFFFIKTESESLGGIMVDLPLPLARYSKPSALRFRTVPMLAWQYRGKVTRAGEMPGGGLSIERLYKELAPTFIRNNVSEWMEARQFI
jgi:hypothetical protein